MEAATMNDESTFSEFGMYVVNDCLVVPVKGNVDDNSIKSLGKKILELVKITQTKGVLINVSAVKVMDSHSFSILRDTGKTIAMLGADCVFVGFQPGVASALIDLDIELDGITTAVTMEDGFEILNFQTIDPEQKDETDESLSESGFSDDKESEIESNE
jgi:anti-anti-sigma factor